ncbi:MAG: hypothetical protein BMS9Abin05_0621 [Rhodothermia bacterium]|nr:MAG: hypothetical protein BMS9Abin05_0621 [Rhodothermia bacterium]
MKDTFAIRPPVYFPNLAYCALMATVDCFVVGDSFQYSRQSFQNRTRIRSPDGAQWLTVPLAGGQHGNPISETRIDYSFHWQKKHLKALRFNYGSTPFYEHYIDDISNIIATGHDSLAELTVASVALTHELLGLVCTLEKEGSNELGENRSTAGTEYLFEADKNWEHTHAPDCRFLAFDHPVYRQNFDGFVEGMSVLDLLFGHGPEAPRILRSGISFNQSEE